MLQFSFALLMLFNVACTDSGGTISLPTDNQERISGYSLLTTDDAHMPYVLNNEDGQEVWFKSVSGSTVIDEINFKSSDGGLTIVSLDNRGVPSMINDGVNIYLIENVTDVSMDVAIINQAKEIDTWRDVEIYGLLDARIRSVDVFANALHSLKNAHEVISTITGLVSCASAPVNVFAVAGCASALFNFTSEVYDFLDANNQLGDNRFVEFFEELRASSEAFFDVYGVSSEIADCLSPIAHSNRVTACVGTFLTLGTNAIDLAREFVSENQDLIDLARGSLNSGDGSIKVTLTWDNEADLDLHIFDPNGHEIFFGNREVSSGGFLDVDDINGFGPENIFWEEAVNGQFVVYVNYYSGSSRANYSVRVQSGEYTKVYHGSLFGSGDTDQVVSFIYGEPLGQLKTSGTSITELIKQ